MILNYEYCGDIDLDGKACGWGTASNKMTRRNLTGTFLDDKPEGVIVI